MADARADEMSTVAGHTSDFCILGGGVIGLTVALELKRRQPNANVVVMEKEASVGMHASGRNSGVLHAGFYYATDSLKARFCREGRQAWMDWCLKEDVDVRVCGKLVVARNEREWPALEKLLTRGAANGVNVHRVDSGEVLRLEPRARTAGFALYSPDSAVIDPVDAMQSLHRVCLRRGIRFALETQYLRGTPRAFETSQGRHSTGFLVNAAGLYADRIAHGLGVGLSVQILPFRGFYLERQECQDIKMHIYPVPNLEMPFLGVHWTATVKNGMKLGPTALPGFWREQYGGIRGFRPSEAFSIARMGSRVLAKQSWASRLAWHATQRLCRGQIVRDASQLVDGVNPGDWKQWGKVGIRAQLVNRNTGAFEMDFRVEPSDNALHVLNAVSPAFTCAFPFSVYLVNQIPGS